MRSPEEAMRAASATDVAGVSIAVATSQNHEYAIPLAGNRMQGCLLLDDTKTAPPASAESMAQFRRFCDRASRSPWAAGVELDECGRFELTLHPAGKASGFGCLLRHFAEQGLLECMVRAFAFERHGVVLPPSGDEGKIRFSVPTNETDAALALRACEAVVDALDAGRTDILAGALVGDNLELRRDPPIKDSDAPGTRADDPSPLPRIVSVQSPDFATDLLDIDSSLITLSEPALHRLLIWMGARMTPFVAGRMVAGRGDHAVRIEVVLLPVFKSALSAGTASVAGMIAHARSLIAQLHPVAVAAPFPHADDFANIGSIPVFDGASSAEPLIATARDMLASLAPRSTHASVFDPFRPDAGVASRGGVCDALLADSDDGLSPTWLRSVRRGGVGLRDAIGHTLARRGTSGSAIATLCDRAGPLSQAELRVRAHPPIGPADLEHAGIRGATACAATAAVAIADVGSDVANVWGLIFRDDRARDHIAAIDPVTAERISYGELQVRSTHRSAWLHSQGVREGSVVASAMKDGIACIELLLACLRIGAVFAPLNITLAPAVLDETLRLLEPHLVLTDPETATQPPASRERRTVPVPGESIESAGQATIPEPVHRVARDFPAVILFTSGSTGTPKGVVHSHADVMNCAHNYAQAVLALSRRDVVYSPSRIFFSYGLNNLLMTLCSGSTLVTATPLGAPAEIADVIDRLEVSVLMSVPAVYKRLLDGVEKRKRPNALRCMVSAGETLPPALYWRLREAYGVDVIDGIGATEVLSTFVSNRPGDSRGGCTGHVVPGFEVALTDEEGRVCAIGQPGSLKVRGNTLAKGYRHDTACFEEAGFDTRDMFFMDALGRLYCLGRINSIIKVNGCWFSAEHLEQTLQAHPSVRECAIAFENDEFDLPRPRAYVVLAEGVRPGPELWGVLRQHSRDAMGKDHYPHFFTALKQLPRTASGKLMRNGLRDAAETQAAVKRDEEVGSA